MGGWKGILLIVCKMNSSYSIYLLRLVCLPSSVDSPYLCEMMRQKYGISHRQHSQQMKGILFDLDGVFYVEQQLIPGGIACLDWLREQGVPTDL